MPALEQFTKSSFRKPFLCVLTALLFFMTGCALGRPKTISYVHPTYDFSQVKKLAVLPFVNESGSAASENIRRMVIVELLSMGYVDVIEPGQTTKVLAESNLPLAGPYTKEDIKKVGQKLEVPVVLLGALSTYERSTVSGVSIPEINISMWAIETESGSIVWSVISLSKGLGVSGQLFGFSSDTMSEASMDTVRKAVQTLFK